MYEVVNVYEVVNFFKGLFGLYIMELTAVFAKKNGHVKDVYCVM